MKPPTVHSYNHVDTGEDSAEGRGALKWGEDSGKRNLEESLYLVKHGKT